MSVESEDIVQSVVRLTEESDNSAPPSEPPSAEGSPSKSPASPDVIVEEETTEVVVKEGDEKKENDQGDEEQKAKKEKKKKNKDPKNQNAWRVKAQRSKITRESKLEPYLKNIEGPLVGLEHITEYHDEDPQVPVVYTNSLCEVQCSNMVQLVQHLQGYKHRLAYLKQHIAKLEDPFTDCEIDGFDSIETLKREDQTALINKLAQDLEEKTGRNYEKIDVFVKVSQAKRQGRRYAGGFNGNYGNRPISKYHPANAHLLDDEPGFTQPQQQKQQQQKQQQRQQQWAPGVNSQAFTKSAGTLSFSDVLPLLYRCEIFDEEDASLALQASNLINKRILEFDASSSYNRHNQRHRPHSNYDGVMNAPGVYNSLFGPQNYSPEAPMDGRTKHGAARHRGHGKVNAHLQY